MVGRIPVLDVTPVVEGGRYPAKAAVGEPFEVSALVFREGHDALSADVVLTDPRGERRPPVRMHQAARRRSTAGPPRSCADAEGAWTFEIESLERPGRHLAAQRRDQDPGRHRRRADVHRGRPAARAGRGGPPQAGHRRARSSPTPSRALRDTDPPRAGRLAAAVSPEVDEVLAAHPLRDLVTTEGPFPFFADRERALYGSWYEFFPRSEGAYVDATTGKVVSGTFQTAAERLDAVAGMGFDVIYLPPIHPIGEVNRKGPQQHPDPRPRRRRLAVGDRLRGRRPRRRPPRPRHDRGLRRLRRRGPTSSASRSRSTSRCRRPRTTRGSPSNPEWFTTRADGTIAYAENPPKKYQDIYPINFDNDPDGHLRRGAPRRPALDEPRRADLPRRQPAHQAGAVLGVAARRGPQDRPRRALPVRGVHQAGDDAGARHGRLPPVLHLLHLAQRQVGARGVPHRGLPRDQPRAAAELLRQHPRHPARVPAVRRAAGVQDPRGARRDRLAVAGACTPASSSSSTSRCKPGSEEYLDSEKYQIRIRDWEAAEAEGRTLAPYLTLLNEIRREHPPLQLLRNLHVHNSDDDSIVVFSKTASTAAGDEHVIVVVNVDPHAHPRDHRPPRHARARAGLGRPVPRPRRGHRRDLDLGRAQLRPARPLPRARPHPHRAEALRLMPEPTTNDPTASTGDYEMPATAEGLPDARARLVQDGGLLRGPRPVLQGQQRRRRRRLQGPDREARLPAVARRRLPVGAAVLHLAAARRRLRRRRLHRRAPRGRHDRRLPRVPRRGPRRAASG